MNDLLKKLLPEPLPESSAELITSLREILQSMALLGLWRAKFFNHAAFYGGTALRILYGLNRFSEDLDFSLLEPSDKFELKTYLAALESELKAFGFDVRIELKEKTSETSVESAFLKGNTTELLIVIEAPQHMISSIHPQSVIKIKLEIDTQPPMGFDTEMKYVFTPVQFAVRSYTLPSLFAGKMHALLCRKWKNRVKGRDWYDFAWYISHHPRLNLRHLEQRMRDSGHYTANEPLSSKQLQEFLDASISELDIASARQEVAPFLRDPRLLDIWSKDFFYAASRQIVIIYDA